MTGVAAMTNHLLYIEDPGSHRLRIWVALKALGVVGIYISDLPQRSIRDDFMVLIFGRPIKVQNVRKSETCENVLEIDVEAAWKESGESAGWSNEVAVEVFVSGKGE